MAAGNALRNRTKADDAVRAGNLQEARTLYLAVCRTDPADIEAFVMLGIMHRRLGELDASEACCRRAVALGPKLNFARYLLGTTLQSQGKREEAMACYRQAIELQPAFADAHYMLGSVLHETGAVAEAVACYGQAIALRPDFAEALGDYGAALIELGEVETAAGLLQRARVLQPDNPYVLSNISHILRLQGRVDEALAIHRQALRLAPDSIDILAGLASLLEKTGYLEEAQGHLERGMQLAPESPALMLVAAQMARRQGRWQAAAGLLETVRRQRLLPRIAGEALLLLGQVYDQMGDAARAFPLIVEGNRHTAQVSLRHDGDRQRYAERVSAISRYATPALALCPPSVNDADRLTPAFLIGFPRSGTTLLEQMLDSHPALQTLEERGAVGAMVNRFFGQVALPEDALARLSMEEIRRLRQEYFGEVGRHLVLHPGALLVDKMALNTVWTPVIWRVFPQAKFILSIRHPCDVCLSCLMQNFATNEAMVSFFTLEDTVRAYVEVMSAWIRYVDLLPLQYHRIRYEDLIADVAGETRRLLDFLGVGWDPAVLDHTEYARQRGAILTPSYHQVIQPIYQHARFRWKRYEKEFVPFMASLRPFIEYFGYAE